MASLPSSDDSEKDSFPIAPRSEARGISCEYAAERPLWNAGVEARAWFCGGSDDPAGRGAFAGGNDAEPGRSVVERAVVAGGIDEEPERSVAGGIVERAVVAGGSDDETGRGGGRSIGAVGCLVRDGGVGGGTDAALARPGGISCDFSWASRGGAFGAELTVFARVVGAGTTAFFDDIGGDTE